jgi:tRNA threonylcarbamoyladenosine biosynthesis protein TsaB
LPTGPARRVGTAMPRAASLMRLAQAMWQAGEALPAEQALPLYVRDKVAQTTLEREAQRAGASTVGATAR